MELLWLNNTKYYKIITQFDLFYKINLICIWGRLSTKRGGYKVIVCDNEEEMESRLRLIKRRRTSHGYKFIKSRSVEEL